MTLLHRVHVLHSFLILLFFSFTAKAHHLNSIFFNSKKSLFPRFPLLPFSSLSTSSPKLSRKLAPSHQFRFSYRPVSVLDHDETCFTQGLEFLSKSTFLESCGLYGRSKVQTGTIQSELKKQQSLTSLTSPSMPVSMNRSIPVSRSFFLEGVTLYKTDRAFALTWKSGKVLQLSLPSLETVAEHDWPLNGWGIANAKTVIAEGTSGEEDIVKQGTVKSTNVFYATDGSHFVRKFVFHENALDVREKGRFELLEETPVRCGRQGSLTNNLNEVEFVLPHFLYINVWMTSSIVVLNLATKECEGVLDLSEIVREENKREGRSANRGANGGNVLNGIAVYGEWEGATWNEEDDVHLVVTGKRWNHFFEIIVDHQKI